MEQLSTNILIIGKSGTGKSSLLNYMFGEALRSTGSGAPKTEKGVFPEEYMHGDNFLMRIYDTWGLEAGKDKEWQKLIYDEVETHEKKNIREWFSTVILCLSANAERLEPYEVRVINKLLSEWKTQVTVVITHCKEPTDPRAWALKKEILSSVKKHRNQMNSDDIIFVNSVSKKLLGQKNKTATFGREEIFSSIIRNLWLAFRIKVPFKVRQTVGAGFLAKKEEFQKGILGKSFLFRKVSAMEDIENHINDEYETFIMGMLSKVNRQFAEAAEYYYALSKTYAKIGLEIDVEDYSTGQLKFNAFDKFEEEIRDIFKGLARAQEDIMDNEGKERIIEILAEMKAWFTSKKRIRNELVHGVNKFMDQAERSLEKQISKIERRISALDPAA